MFWLIDCRFYTEIILGVTIKREKMKKDLRFLFFIILSVFILANNLAQNSLLKKEVQIEKKYGTIEELLNEISTKGSFIFSYSNNLPLQKEIRLKATKQTVEDYLNEIFTNIRIEYIERNNKIILVFHNNKEKKSSPLQQTIKGIIIESLGIGNLPTLPDSKYNILSVIEKAIKGMIQPSQRYQNTNCDHRPGYGITAGGDTNCAMQQIAGFESFSVG